MKCQPSASIINTSSMVSITGRRRERLSDVEVCCQRTDEVAGQRARDNIRVNAVAPGVTNTDMVSALPDDVIAPLIATIPLGRVGEPEDMANAFLFLASDMASYITGAVLPVDGAARS